MAAPAHLEERPADPAPAAPPSAGGVLERLRQAREALELKDRPRAMAIYEEVLAAAGDRPDVLVTISGDLGVTGNTRQIIDLVAPRYDAQRHGPATGFNLLQAFIALRDPEAAQHVLDLLFALNRPDLEERLLGFSNAIADMMLLGTAGTEVPADPSAETAAGDGPVARQGVKIELINITKPIWYYGCERVAGLLPPKEGRLRRVAFGQLALLGVANPEAVMKRPEDELGRLSRGIPLWLAETLCFSANYIASASVATMNREHYGLFFSNWTPEHIRRVVESMAEEIDYVFIGALQQRNEDYELVLRLWEVKKFRERKVFVARWTPATADQALAELQTQMCAFMEFQPYPAGKGLAYSPPSALRDYVEALGADLTLFLAEKQVLPATQAIVPPGVAERLGRVAAQSEVASLLALGMQARARRLGLAEPSLPPVLACTPLVDQARQVLES